MVVFNLDQVSAEPAPLLRCRTVVSSRYRQTNHVRALAPIAVEEPFGSDAALDVATPSETLLMALGSCLGARIHANAASGSIQVRSLELEVEVDVKPGTMWEPRGTEPGAVGFETIRIVVHMEANASPAALRALISHALLWSPVANTLYGPVHLDIALGRTTGPAEAPPPAGSEPT